MPAIRMTFSKNEMEIVALAKTGLSPVEIVTKLGRSTVGSVHVVLCRARKARKLGTDSYMCGQGAQIPRKLYAALDEEALERDLETPDFIRLLLRNMVEKKLIETVLK
jgi:hypothetical protein